MTSLTSDLGKAFRPFPGIMTNVAPLLPVVEPTVIPYSEVGAKWVGLRSCGVMNVTGVPKGKWYLASTLGAMLVTISVDDVKLSSCSFVFGRQFAVWTHDSTA